ncbi:MAG: heparinase II/III family protein [Oscillospiraceae bacterium]|nr:heparinase II/III family protein [Oscillospiraceae bacterium]
MKRFLSFILMLCMVISMLPATVIFAAAEDGVLYYDISSNAFSDDAIANYGSLQSNTASTDVIDNKELIYVNWTSMGGKNPVVDTSKTEGFAFPGRVVQDDSPIINASGFQSRMKIINDTDGNNYEAASYGKRPWIVIKLKVPAAGNYKLSLSNGFTADDSAVTAVVSLGEQRNGAQKGKFDKGAVPKVYFASAAFATTYGGRSNVVNNGAYFGDFVQLADEVGFYDVNKLATDANTPYITEVGNVNVPVAGEYYIFFDIDAESVAKNAKAWYRKGNCFQMFLLSGITLTPVEEGVQISEVLDLTLHGLNLSATTAANAIKTDGCEIVTGKTTNSEWKPLKKFLLMENGMPLPIPQGQMSAGVNTTWQDAADADKYKSMFTVKKEFNAPGYYSVSMFGGKWASGADASIYINGEYIGDYDFYDASATANAVFGGEKKLNTVYIPESGAEISLRVRKTYGSESTSTPNLMPISMKFEPVNVQTLTATEVENDAPKQIIVGESATVTARVKMSDGSYHGFGLNDSGTADSENTVTVTPVDGSFATVSDVSFAAAVNEKDITFKVNASKVGTTDIKVTVSLKGREPYTETIPVKIIPVPGLDKVNLTLSKTTLPKTRTAQASVELIGTDGEAWTEETSVVYESSDKDVISIAEKDGVVTVTAKEEGTAEIYALATSQGKPEVKSNVITVTVTPEPVLSSVTLAADTAVLIPDSTAKVSVSGMMDDGIDADMSEYTVSYKSSNSAVAEIDAATGDVITHDAGLSVITAEVFNEDGIKLTAKLTLNVYDTLPSIKVDFSESKYNGDDGNGNRPAPTTTPGYTIVTEESDTKHWRLGTCADTGFSVAYIRTHGGVWPATQELTNNAITILVNVPYEHDFSIKMHTGVWNVGGVYSVFVDDQYAGDINCYDASASNVKDIGEATLNTLHLKAGERKISFRVRQKNYSGGKIGILVVGTITLDPVAKSGTEFTKMGNIIPAEIAVGETLPASVFAEMTDGSALHYGINNDGSEDVSKQITVESQNADALAVSGFANYTPGHTGKLPFTIKGVSTGNADEVDVTLVINASIDGAVQEPETVTVKVKNDALATVEAKASAEEIFLGDSVKLTAVTSLASGREIDRTNAPVTYTTEDTDIISISGDTLTTKALGKAKIKASATFNGTTVYDEFEIEVLPEGLTSISVTSGGSPRIRLTDNHEDKYPLIIRATSNLGKEIDLSDAEISVTAQTPELAEIAYETYPAVDGTPGYYISPIAEGTAKFDVTVTTSDGRTRTKTVELPVVLSKTGATYMTDTKRDIARENMKQYDWAKTQAETYITNANKYVNELDKIYALIASQEVPRSMSVGGEKDDFMYYCRYCGENLQTEYGNYPWIHNPLSRAWKIQCPDCNRLFPSNDFESFYKLGLNEYGEFIYQDALDKHRELFGDKSVTEPGVKNSKQWKAYYGYGAEGGYLTNILYDDLENNEDINCGQGLREGETEATWGVDDGYGYVPSNDAGKAYLSGPVAERHNYIAEFMHYGVFQTKAGDNGGVLTNAIVNCAYAYYYTGDAKYGRVAAILLDRVADLYRDYEIAPFGNNVWNSDGGSNTGKRIGCIWETSILTNEIPAYDMVYELYEDEQVINYIRENNKGRYSKQSAAQIRQNIEDNFLRGVLEGVYNYKIYGNFGMSQRVVAMTAIILDSFPETGEWIDYLMAPGWGVGAPVVGGGINEVLIEKVCADGHSNEASDYGLLWLSGTSMVNTILSEYEKYDGGNLSDNPKYHQMFLALLPLRAANSYSPQIGDGGTTADLSHWATVGHMKAAFTQTREPIFAQYMYMLNGNSTEGLKYDIYTKDPERLADEVQAVIDEHGTLELDSDIQTGFGYSILRDGVSYENNITDATSSETTRNVWMYFGSNGVSHAHLDALNIGMTAFGLNILPDLGYPEKTGNDPNRIQWVRNTLSHNTVVVNEEKQRDNTEVRGKVKHYDDADKVQVIDVDTSYVYPDTEQYRRSVVMVNVDDANSYYIDLFRILGGNSHIYSFHAQSNEIAETVGLSLTKQADDDGNYKGTYAGIDTKYGQDPKTANSWEYETEYPIGYTWLENVDRDEEPKDKIEVDFAIKDFNKAVKDSKGIRLRMTMLNGSNVADGADVNVAIADGYPPRVAANKNIDKLKYVLIENENKSEMLDTVFTTVLEPYKGNRVIKTADELEMQIDDGRERSGDAARAVRVELASGRVDYIFYATNNEVTYSVNDNGREILFRGFVGVYTVENNKNTYKYVLDGDIIGEETGKRAGISGVVADFTKELSHVNTIEFKPDSAVSD